MKSILLALGLFCVTTAFADAPKQIHWSLERAYVPVGFDDNDRIQFTVSGVFDSTCLKVGPYRAEVDETRKEIQVDQKAYEYQGICIQMQVPFNQVIEPGILSAGDWNVVDHNSGKVLGKVTVAVAKNAGPDDFLYAPVSDATIRDTQNGRKEVCLQGTFSDRCTKLKEVLINQKNDVIIVQPIAEHLKPQDGCGAAEIRYSHCELLSAEVKGVQLLHVRSMNGQAINKIVDLR